MVKRGRPRIDPSSPSAVVNLTLSERQYQQIAQIAKVQRASIQDVIRVSLKAMLATKKV